MNKHRRVYFRPINEPIEADADAPTAPSIDEAAAKPHAVRVEVPPVTRFDDLSDTEWSAFRGLRSGQS